jgi:hypothetical protein
VLDFGAFVEGDEGELENGYFAGYPDLVFGNPVVGVPVAALVIIGIEVVSGVRSDDYQNGQAMRTGFIQGSQPGRQGPVTDAIR